MKVVEANPQIGFALAGVSQPEAVRDLSHGPDVSAHQYLQQLSPELRHAVLGNIGTIVSFRVGMVDAPYLAKELEDEFDQMDFIRLANYRAYIKLMIDGAPSKPFSASTLGPAPTLQP